MRVSREPEKCPKNPQVSHRHSQVTTSRSSRRTTFWPSRFQIWPCLAKATPLLTLCSRAKSSRTEAIQTVEFSRNFGKHTIKHPESRPHHQNPDYRPGSTPKSQDSPSFATRAQPRDKIKIFHSPNKSKPT